MVQNNKNNSAKLLEALDKLLSNVGDNFGPIILEELKLRIDKTINDFNDEVSEMLKTSFSNHNNDCSDFKAFKKKKVEEINVVNKEDADVPNFIKEHSTKKDKK